MIGFILLAVGLFAGYCIGSFVEAVSKARERAYYLRQIRRYEKAFHQEKKPEEIFTLRVVDETKETPLKFGDE